MKRKRGGQRKGSNKRIKLISKVVKKITTQTFETRNKFGVQSPVSVPNAFDGGGRIINPLYGILRGTGEGDYTGNAYTLCGISVKFYVESALNKDVDFYYAFIQHELEDDTTIWDPLVSQGSVFEGTSGPGSCWRVDQEKCKVLKKGHLGLHRKGFSGTASNSKAVYLKLKRKIEINPSTGFLKNGKNVYIVVWGNIANAAINDNMTLNSNIKVYFKDT